jgi:hypothetical protein
MESEAGSGALEEAFAKFSISGTVATSEVRAVLLEVGVHKSETWVANTTPELEGDRVTLAGMHLIREWAGYTNRPERGYDAEERKHAAVFTAAFEAYEPEFWARTGYAATDCPDGSIRLVALADKSTVFATARGSDLVAERERNLALPTDERSVVQTLEFSGPTTWRLGGERISCTTRVSETAAKGREGDGVGGDGGRGRER